MNVSDCGSVGTRGPWLHFQELSSSWADIRDTEVGSHQVGILYSGAVGVEARRCEERAHPCSMPLSCWRAVECGVGG